MLSDPPSLVPLLHWYKRIDNFIFTNTQHNLMHRYIVNSVVLMYGEELMTCALYWLYNVVVPCRGLNIPTPEELPTG